MEKGAKQGELRRQLSVVNLRGSMACMLGEYWLIKIQIICVSTCCFAPLARGRIRQKRYGHFFVFTGVPTDLLDV